MLCCNPALLSATSCVLEHFAMIVLPATGTGGCGCRLYTAALVRFVGAMWRWCKHQGCTHACPAKHIIITFVLVGLNGMEYTLCPDVCVHEAECSAALSGANHVSKTQCAVSELLVSESHCHFAS